MGDTLVKNLNEKQLARIRNEQIGIVMQDYALVEDFTALQNVMLPLDFARKKQKRRKQIALDVLEKVEMLEFANKTVAQLSGGQKQRVAIARALVNDPDILLADEPTGALDSANAEAIMELFQKIHENGTTVILVTHDMELAARCERKIEIVDGSVWDEL